MIVITFILMKSSNSMIKFRNLLYSKINVYNSAFSFHSSSYSSSWNFRVRVYLWKEECCLCIKHNYLFQKSEIPDSESGLHGFKSQFCYVSLLTFFNLSMLKTLLGFSFFHCELGWWNEFMAKTFLRAVLGP